MLSGGTMLRGASLVLMLMIIGMTINRFRPRGVMAPPPNQQVAGEPRANERAADDAAAEAPAAPQPVIAVQPGRPAAPAPAPEPIERDPEEQAAFEHDAEAIADKSLTILPVEQKAYWQLIRWVTQEPLATLVAQHPPEVSYQNLVLRPEKHRGELFQMELLVRRALRYDAPEGNSAGIQTMYELWGWPANAHGRMYTVVTTELPPGFPIGAEVEETARIYGYFFKLQGYELGSAKPYAAPQVSPLLVGRVQWTPYVSPNATVGNGFYVALAAAGALMATIIGFWIWSAYHRPATLAMLNATLPASADGDRFDRQSGQDDDSDEAPSDPFGWVKDEDGHEPG